MSYITSISPVPYRGSIGWKVRNEYPKLNVVATRTAGNSGEPAHAAVIRPATARIEGRIYLDSPIRRRRKAAEVRKQHMLDRAVAAVARRAKRCATTYFGRVSAPVWRSRESWCAELSLCNRLGYTGAPSPHRPFGHQYHRS